MAWTAPRTWTVGEIVTSTIMNVDHRDNLNAIDARLDIDVALADGGPLVGGGSGLIRSLGVLAKGVIMIGDGTTDPVLLTVGPNGATILADSAVAHGAKWSSAGFEVVSLTFIIDGNFQVITTGIAGHLEIPFAMTITGWTILGDQSGSIVVDVWKDIYANFPPTVADTITGTEKPTLSSAQKNQDLTLSTWATAVAAGDVLLFNVDSVTTVQRVVLSIRGTKS